jgi:hypothetical protein
MAIITLDGALAGMQPPIAISKAVTTLMMAGRPQSLWAAPGFPGAGAYNGTINGVALSSSSALVAGQIPHYDPGSGNSYLGRLVGNVNQFGTLLLLDRLWHNGGISITSTGVQSISQPTLPARDANGATAGVGVLAALECSTALGNVGSPTANITYTNSAGSVGSVGLLLDPTQAAETIGGFHRFALSAGDLGIQHIQAITLGSTWTSGTINLVLYRLLAMLEVSGLYISSAIDALTSGFPQIFNGTVPFLVFIPQTATAAVISGAYTETQG